MEMISITRQKVHFTNDISPSSSLSLPLSLSHGYKDRVGVHRSGLFTFVLQKY